MPRILLLTYTPTNIEEVPLPIWGDFSKYVIIDYKKKWGVKTSPLEEADKVELNKRKDNFPIYLTMELLEAIFSKDPRLDKYCINYDKMCNSIRKLGIKHFPNPTIYKREIEDFVIDTMSHMWIRLFDKLDRFQKEIGPDKIACCFFMKAQFWHYLAMTCFTTFYDHYMDHVTKMVQVYNPPGDAEDFQDEEATLSYLELNGTNFASEVAAYGCDSAFDGERPSHERTDEEINAIKKEESKAKNFISRIRIGLRDSNLFTKEEMAQIYKYFPYDMAEIEGSTTALKLKNNIEAKKIIIDAMRKVYKKVDPAVAVWLIG